MYQLTILELFEGNIDGPGIKLASFLLAISKLANSQRFEGRKFRCIEVEQIRKSSETASLMTRTAYDSYAAA